MVAAAQFGPHVHHLHCGHGQVGDQVRAVAGAAPPHAGRKGQQPVLPFLRPVIGHQVGGGAAQYEYRAGQLPALEGYVACVVAGYVVLLVGPFVLFVHDHQPQSRQGREYRRPRPHDDVGVPLVDSPPFIELLAGGQLAVHQGYPAGEARGEAVHRLGRE